MDDEIQEEERDHQREKGSLPFSDFLRVTISHYIKYSETGAQFGGQ